MRQSIPVDLLNPGQVFACLGLMELSDVLCSEENQRGNTKAGFDWSDEASPRFVVEVQRDVHPVTCALTFLEKARVSTISVEGSGHVEETWKKRPLTMEFCRDSYPFPLPEKTAKLVAKLSDGESDFMLTHWGDGSLPNQLTAGRDNVKFWAGSGGLPGAALLRDALSGARPLIKAYMQNPFALSTLMSSSFRFDWRRDYIPLDAGFSLNQHKSMVPGGYPLVEVLAAIGMTHARPFRVNRSNKYEYQYGVVGELIPMTFLRAALGMSSLPFLIRSFTMQLKPIKDARCITTVQEN